MRVIMSHFHANHATQKKQQYIPTKITRVAICPPQTLIPFLIPCKNIGQNGSPFYLENNWHAACNYNRMTYFLKNTLDELFGEQFQESRISSGDPREIINTEKETLIMIDAPGFNKESLKLEIKDLVLRLHGEEKGESFSRTIDKSYRIGKSMDPKSIKASYKNGVVEISIARKKEQNKTKEIKIT